MMILYIYIYISILGWSDFFIPYCAYLVNFCENRNLKISILAKKFKESRKLLERALIYIAYICIYIYIIECIYMKTR